MELELHFTADTEVLLTVSHMGAECKSDIYPSGIIYLFGALGIAEFNLMLHVTGTNVGRGYHREEGSATIGKRHLLVFLPLAYLPCPVLLSGVMFNDLRILTILRNLNHCPHTD